MDAKQLEDSNRAKYGDKENDIISKKYNLSLTIGDVWCCANAERYVDRFSREGSTKANNLIDLAKARDYLERAIEKSPCPNILAMSEYKVEFSSKREMALLCNSFLESYYNPDNHGKRDTELLASAYFIILKLEELSIEKEDYKSEEKIEA